MHIDKFEDAIMNCRFCFMCRHLSAIGNVRFTEVDTPRVRAAMIYGLRTGTNSFDDEDFVDALYRQDLSACCVHHCVNHYDENGLALAARADVVEAGKAPEAVQKLAKKLKAAAKWTITPGKEDTAWFEDEASAEAKTGAAFAKLAKAAGVKYRTIKGGDIGKTLKTLGFLADAKDVMAAFAAFLKENGIKTLVLSNPALVHAFKSDFAELGVETDVHAQLSVGCFIKNVKFTKKAGALYYLEDDFLRNYIGCQCTGKLLANVKAELKPFGTNDEETYNCGEGAVVLDKLHPEIVKALAEYVAARTDDPKNDRLVVGSPYTKKVLAKYGKLKVETLEELAASCL